MRARDNPFRTDRVLTVRYRFPDGVDGETLFSRLDHLDGRAAIVGSVGSGKTTLQEDLADQLASQGRTVCWLRLNRENRRDARHLIDAFFERATSGDVLFVDGAEQLSPLKWRRFLRRANSYAGLIITTHVPGRLSTLITCRTSPELLIDIVEQLTPSSDCPTGQRLAELFRKHDGNLRLCLRSLYDDWATSTRPNR